MLLIYGLRGNLTMKHPTYKPFGLLNNKSVLKKYQSKSCEKINSPKKTNSAEINTENSANFLCFPKDYLQLIT